MNYSREKKEPFKRPDRETEAEKPKPAPEKWAVEIMVKTKVLVKGVLQKYEKGQIIKNPPKDLLDAADGGVIRKFKI